MHHAYYIEGPLNLFEQYKEILKPFWAKEFEKFGIEDSRALVELTGLKNTGEATFFVATASLTTEAQQALLKLFEEPQAGTTFVLMVPHGTIIPTLRSRMLAYPHQLQGDALTSNMSRRRLAREFLKSAQKERSAYIAKMLKDDEGVKERVRELLQGLEAELHQSLQKTKGDKATLAGLPDIAQVRSYVSDRSPSLKMLLEHLALSLPTLT